MNIVKSVVKFAGYRMLGSVASLMGRGREAYDASAVRRILLVEAALFGDVASFTASLAPARAAFPNAMIDVLVARAFAPLVVHDPCVSTALTMRDFSLGAFLKALREVRRHRYDLILAMSPGLRNAGLAVLGRGRAAAGYLVDRNLVPHYLKSQRVETCGIPLAKSVQIDATTHIADRGLAVLRALGASVPEQGCPCAVVPEETRGHVSTFLGGDDSDVRRFAVLHPSAGEARRRWPVERFVEVARQLLKNHDLGIVWLGSRTDAPLLKKARDLLGEFSNHFLGQPVDEVAALLERATLFVGNDSGPMHLAGAVGTPLVGIFGPGDPGRLLPRRRNAAAVKSREPERGVAAIEVREVLDAVNRVVSKG